MSMGKSGVNENVIFQDFHSFVNIIVKNSLIHFSVAQRAAYQSACMLFRPTENGVVINIFIGLQIKILSVNGLTQFIRSINFFKLLCHVFSSAPGRF